MNISFFVSPLTQYQTNIADLIREGYEKQQLTVAPPLTSSRVENIGNLASITDISQLTLESCITEINALITKNPGADQYVFMGFGLSVFIDKIMLEFPQASVYFCRSNESVSVITPRENKKYYDLSKKNGISIETFKTENEKCKLVIAETVSELGVPYVVLNNLFSTDLNWIDPSTSEVIDTYNFTHANKLEESCEVAIYKPAV